MRGWYALATWAILTGITYGQPVVSKGDVPELSAILGDARVPQSKRDDAARKLVARRTPESKQALISALVDTGNRGGQLAAARALAVDTAVPDPDFVTPLNALMGSDKQLSEVAAQGLTNYRTSPAVMNLLAGFAREPSNAEGSRAGVTRALGQFVDKRVAEVLVGMLKDPKELPSVRSAAADALVNMTGKTEVGRDVAQWLRWWDGISPTEEGTFRTEILLSRAARYDALQAQYGGLTDEISVLLGEGYRQTPDSLRGERLLRFLTSTQPAVRVAGVRIINGDALENRTVPPAARELLRRMVSDSAREVRLEVATAIRALNDAASLDAVLKQVSQEGDAEVRAAQAGALGPMRDRRAVDVLVAMLDDPYIRVAEAAAESLGALGPQIRRDPEASETVAAGLKKTLENRAISVGGDSLKAAVIEALVPLRRRELLPLMKTSLGLNETTRVKRAALRLLGELRDPDTANWIIGALRNSPADVGVRLEAVNALGGIPTFDHAEEFYRLLSSEVETDARVRIRAWSALSDLFSMATREQLLTWGERFQTDPEKRLAVLVALSKRLNAPGEEEGQALVKQQLGETLAKLDRPADAVVPLREALEYWRARKVSNIFTQALYREILDMLLKAQLYRDAAEFAALSIRDTETNRPALGGRVMGEIKTLAEANDLAAAASLMAEVKKTGGVFGPTDLEVIKTLDGAVRERLDPTSQPTTRNGLPNTRPSINTTSRPATRTTL